MLFDNRFFSSVKLYTWIVAAVLTLFHSLAFAQVVPPDVKVTQIVSSNAVEINKLFSINYKISQNPAASTPVASTTLRVELTGPVTVVSTSLESCAVSSEAPLVVTCPMTLSADDARFISVSLMSDQAGEVYSVATVSAGVGEVAIENNTSQFSISTLATGALLIDAHQQLSAGNIRAMLAYDIDGQNGPDLIVVTDNSAYTLLNTGSGTLSAPVDDNYAFSFFAGAEVTKIAINDFDASGGAPELVMSTTTSDDFLVYELTTLENDFSVSHGGVQRVFSAGTTLFLDLGNRLLVSEDANTRDFAFIDLDRDLLAEGDTAYPELITVNAGATPSAIQLFSGLFYLSLFIDTDELTTRDSRSLAMADFNNDQYMDLVFANYDMPSQIFMADTDVNDRDALDRYGAAQNIGTSSGSLKVLAADFDGHENNLPDLIIVGEGTSNQQLQRSDQVMLYANTGNAAFSSGERLTRVNGFVQALAEDVDNDGDVDLVVHDQSGLARLIRNQQGLAASSSLAIHSASDSIISLADLNRDGVMDLVVGSKNGMGLRIYLTPHIGDQSLANSAAGGGYMPWLTVLILLVFVIGFGKKYGQ